MANLKAIKVDNTVYDIYDASARTSINNAYSTLSAAQSATNTKDLVGAGALVDVYTTLKSSFQAGVDSVYNAIKNQGTTPSSKSLSDINAAIATLSNARYAAGVSSVTLSTSGRTVTASNSKTASVAYCAKASSGTNYGNVAVSNGAVTITSTAATGTISYPLVAGWCTTPIKVNQTNAYNAGLKANAYGGIIVTLGWINSENSINGALSTAGSPSKTMTLPAGTYAYYVLWCKGMNHSGEAYVKVGSTKIASVTTSAATGTYQYGDDEDDDGNSPQRWAFGTYTLSAATSTTCGVSGYGAKAVACIMRTS